MQLRMSNGMPASARAASTVGMLAFTRASVSP